MNKIQLETVQWASLPDIDAIEPICDKDYKVLDELRFVLVKHGYTHRFGISLLHRHFDLAHDEVLMETTDTEARISTLAVERHEEQSANSIGTMWRFSSQPDPHGVTKCVLRCHVDSGHVQRHFKEGY